jgi:hypothetical protein
LARPNEQISADGLYREGGQTQEMNNAKCSRVAVDSFVAFAGRPNEPGERIGAVIEWEV